MARTRAELLDDYTATCASLGDKVLVRENLTDQLAGMEKAIETLKGKARVLLEEIAAAPQESPPTQPPQEAKGQS